MDDHHKIPKFNWLDLETLRSQAIVPNIPPDTGKDLVIWHVDAKTTSHLQQ